ncbi:hypothetical protein E3P81_00474 [Wallemia ichthyophaga]|nr:hypothetical protein E3P97_00476 [Wallemia ichthyophaga]TIB54009.1 hypothetical protein E3P81_00474 [Wallemia ichthyophaga]
MSFRGGGFQGRGGGRGVVESLAQIGLGFRGGRPGGGFQQGPPAEVLEMGEFQHAVEADMLCSSTNAAKVPYFNAPIYLQNKNQIGKVDEILGPINEVYFTIKMQEGMVATSFKKGDKVFIGSDKLLPIERFLPKPKTEGAKVAKPARGGRGGARGGFGGRGRGAPRGGGGFRGGGRGGGELSFKIDLTDSEAVEDAEDTRIIQETQSKTMFRRSSGLKAILKQTTQTTHTKHIRLSSNFNKASPPLLPPEEQREFERLRKDAETSSLSGNDNDLHKDAVREAKRTEFDGQVNPQTGEVGGPKREPLRWQSEWTYGGRATDF